MDFFYLDGGPFETASITGRVVFVVAYDAARNMFLAAPLDGNPFWNSRVAFDPQPPIPAAARKPQVGEVWIHKDGQPRFLFLPDTNIAGAWFVVSPDGACRWCEGYKVYRPATPEEAEPFRPLLEGLKRSLGEA